MDTPVKSWRERVIEAEARGEFTLQDRLDAGIWQTCAVGEQHRLHPEIVIYTEGVSTVPVDEELRRLGGGAAHNGFAMAVAENDIPHAWHLLDAIEARAHTLKMQHRGEVGS